MHDYKPPRRMKLKRRVSTSYSVPKRMPLKQAVAPEITFSKKRKPRYGGAVKRRISSGSKRAV